MSQPDRSLEYAARHQAQSLRVTALQQRSKQYSQARLGVFLLAVTCFIVGAREFGDLHPPWLVASLVTLILFSWLVRRHAIVVNDLDEARGLVALNAAALARLARQWSELPTPMDSPSGNAVAHDLDLFGPASLAQLLGTVHTPPGQATLRAWLGETADARTARDRLDASAELAPDLDGRQRFELLAQKAASAGAHHERFLEWAEQPDHAPGPGRVWFLRSWTLALPLLALAQVLGWTAWPLWLPVFTINLALTARRAPDLHVSFSQVEAREGEYQVYRGLLQRMEASSPQASMLQRIRGAVAGPPTASQALHRLHALSGHSQLRRSMMYLPVQALTLWDQHVETSLRQWRVQFGGHARGWLDALGELEAVMALASLRQDHPDWVEPERVDRDDAYDAVSLGHPLLRPDRCVRNDVSLGPAGKFLLVTGSNMSGKSTLLRAIGLNAVLARMGSVVCAERFAWSPMDVATSMRVEDSLARGVSQYMAELERLKEVVDCSAQAQARGSRVLFLLDEILRGTNSAERQIAVRRVLGHLLRHGGVGAISTHDLELAEVPELQSAAVRVHFRETYRPGHEPPMTFDYTMRDGVATSTNALALLRLVGLDTPDDEAEHYGPRAPV